MFRPKHVQTELAVTQSQSVQLHQSHPDKADFPQGGISLVAIEVLLSWAIAFIIYLISLKATGRASREIKYTLGLSHNVPCRGCRFYHNDPYLKCAVRPTVAMTKTAIDCSDYHPRNEKNQDKHKAE